jgi:dienelactone hydrolase
MKENAEEAKDKPAADDKAEKKDKDTPAAADAKKDDTKKDDVKKEDAKKKPAIKVEDDELPGLVIWHWQDKRLQAQQQVMEMSDKNYTYLSVFNVENKKFMRLAYDSLKRVSIPENGKYAIAFDNSNYELTGNLDGKNYNDIYTINLETGETKLALKQSRWSMGVSPDGNYMLYYSDGQFYTYELKTGSIYNLTSNIPSEFVDTDDDHNVAKPPVYPIGWSKDSKTVLLSDKWDVWAVPVTGGKGINITVNGKQEQIRYQRRITLDYEEKGIDLSKPLYFSTYGEWTKKGGISLVNYKKPGAKPLLWDDAVFNTLIKAKKADVYLYTKETYKDFPDYYAAGEDLANGKKITDVGAQTKDYLWSAGSILVNYKSDKGVPLQGALYLPANYEKGKSYPTVVYYYEKMSQGLNGYTRPSANGFNKSYYTSQGYAVFMPDIVYQLNDPGMSAVWCVVPGVKAAIATGVVDKDHIGIQGHSWGGYQTAFLITQTDMFKAAVAGAPLTDMVSMYSLIYWNSGSGNMSIFESSQGRFTGSPLDNFDAYIRNSPVYHANNVKTPLIILHNDKDGAVDWTQGIEYYSTLRRLQKPVVMLQYKGENHGLAKPENQRDYTVRMKEFFDHYLMGKTSPDWWAKGISNLKLKDYLKERVKDLKEKIEDAK